MVIFVTLVHNCTFENGSRIRNFSSGAEITVSRRKVIEHIVFLIIAVVALLTNSLALVILHRRAIRQNMGSLRLHLTLLSGCEVTLSLVFLVHCVAFLVTRTRNNMSYRDIVVDLQVMNGVKFCLDSTQCLRNWCVALLALARAEVVLRPMWKAIGRRGFSSAKITGFFIFFLVVSIVFSLIRHFMEKVEICWLEKVFNFTDLLGKYKLFKVFQLHIFLAYQRVLPNIVIFVASGVLVYSLLGRLKERPIAQGASQDHYQRRIMRKTARTVLVLSVIYTALETPVFFFIISQFYPPRNSSSTKLWAVFKTLNDCCIILNSCCNFFVYILTDRRFKEECLRLFGVKRPATDVLYRSSVMNQRVRNSGRLHTSPSTYSAVAAVEK